MHEDLNIQYPPHAHCILHQQSDTYSCQIALSNHGTTTLYFHIASTFGLYLKETTDIRHISPSETITLSFTIRSTNIISHTGEFVAISISSNRLSQLCSLSYAQKVIVHLRFTQNFVDDPMIEEVVGEQVSILMGQAEILKNSHRYSESRIKYEEAFQLLRKCHEALIGMAQCSFMLKEWSILLRDIETALLYSPENIHYQFLKIKGLIACYGTCKTWQGEIIQECFKSLKNMEIKYILMLSENEKEELKQLLSSIQENPFLNRMRFLKKSVIEKALQKYSQQHQISKYFPSKTELNKQLRETLLCDEVEENATPEQVVDPISYQIMSNPAILPSGQSFQQKTLQQYFQKNGYKDPITRKDTYPQWIFPNINLRDFIRQNPKLPIWRQYEYDLIHK